MEETFFYVVGGAVVVVALIVSFIGMRSDSFPTSGALMRVGIALFAVLVVVTAGGAIVAARHEQQHRIEEQNKESSEEAAGTEEENIEQEDPEGAGEAAQQPGAGAGTGDVDGRTVFIETGCGSCHTLAEVPEATGEIGPNLDVELENQNAEFVRTSIVDPSAEVAEGFPDNTMPSNYGDELSDPELDALVDFLLGQSSGAGGRQPPAGQGGGGGGGNAGGGSGSGGNAGG